MRIRARPLAHDKDRVVAVEGYMDVIALSEAGFGECVAPLGTALTENQAQLLWRMAPEPILCFDGDSAGKKAAYRAVETVLPLLKPGFSVQFAFLPDGLDPDDLIRQQGPAAFEAILATKRKPLFDALIEKEEVALGPTTTPEQRSALEIRLKALVARIVDGTVRGHYEQALRQVLWERTRREIRGPGEQFSGGGYKRTKPPADWRTRERALMAGPGQGGRPRSGAGPGVGGRPGFSLPVQASAELAERSLPMPAREALILATLINHPWLAVEEAETISGLLFRAEPASRLRDGILSAVTEQNSLDREGLATQLTDLGLATVVALVQRAITHKGDKFAEPEADPATVEKGWRHAVALHTREEGLRRELDAALQAWEREGTEDSFETIREIKSLLARRDGGDADSI